MAANVVERDAVVGLADRPRKAGAGRSKRLEAELLQRLGAADIEGVGDDETSGLMHLPDRRALVCCRDRHGLSCFCFVFAQRYPRTVYGARARCSPRPACGERSKAKPSGEGESPRTRTR